MSVHTKYTGCGISQLTAVHFVGGHILGNWCSNRETCARRNLCKEWWHHCFVIKKWLSEPWPHFCIHCQHFRLTDLYRTLYFSVHMRCVGNLSNSNTGHTKWRETASLVTFEHLFTRVPVVSRFFFSSPRHPDRLWGPPNLLSNEYRRGSSDGGKANHSPPTTSPFAETRQLT
jgi:hypothetical protein